MSQQITTSLQNNLEKKKFERKFAHCVYIFLQSDQLLKFVIHNGNGIQFRQVMHKHPGKYDF